MGAISPDQPPRASLEPQLLIQQVTGEIDAFIQSLPKLEKTAAVLFFTAEKRLEDLMQTADPKSKIELKALQKKLFSILGSKFLHLTKDKEEREGEFLQLMQSSDPEDGRKLKRLLGDVQAPRRFGIILSKELVLSMYTENADLKAQAKEKCETLLKGLVSGKVMREKLFHSMPELKPLVREYLFFYSPAAPEMGRMVEILSDLDKAQNADEAVVLFKEAMQKNNQAKEKIGKGEPSNWADDSIRTLYEQIEEKAIVVIDRCVKEHYDVPAIVAELKSLASIIEATEDATELGDHLGKYDALTNAIVDAYPKQPMLTTKLIQRSGLDAALASARLAGINRLSRSVRIQESISEAKSVLESQIEALPKEELLKELLSTKALDKVLESLKVPQVVRRTCVAAVFQSPQVEELFSATRADDFEAVKRKYTQDEVARHLLQQAYVYFVQISGPHFVMGDTGEALNKLLNALSDRQWMRLRGVEEAKFDSIQSVVRRLKDVFDELSIRPKKKPIGDLTVDFLKTAGEMLFYLDPEKAKALQVPLSQLPFAEESKEAIGQQLELVIEKMQKVHEEGLKLVAEHARARFMHHLRQEPNSQKRQEHYARAFQEDANLEEVARFSASGSIKDFLESVKELALTLAKYSQTPAFGHTAAKGGLMLRAQELLNIVSKGVGMTAYEMLRNCQLHSAREQLLAMKAAAKEVTHAFDALLR